MLGAMDSHTIRIVIGALLVAVSAATLASSVGKPLEWDPTFYGLRPNGLGGRDRVRIYATVGLVLGALIAIYFGAIAP